MRRLDRPIADPIDVYNTCVSGIDEPAIRLPYLQNKGHITAAIQAFDAATAKEAWADLARVPRGTPERIIAGTLTKKQLTDLYTKYMVASSNSAREIYDDLLVAAGGLCPFCGGLGQVSTLDHYLPKANFPLYSVLPANLVPCCKDCNTGKNASFGAARNKQTLHPYLDAHRFFNERWVTAHVLKTNPPVLVYVCSPPPTWSVDDQERVKEHFESYNLSARFSVQAGAELARLVDLRVNSLRFLSANQFRLVLLESADTSSFDLNGWSRTMYSALAATDWFWKVDFTNPHWDTMDVAAA